MKVGDKVKVVKCDGNKHEGKIGNILKNDSKYIHVDFEGTGVFFDSCSALEVEPVSEIPKREFKVGDRVRVIRGVQDGEEGKIIKIDPFGRLTIGVELYNNSQNMAANCGINGWWLTPDNLELIESPKEKEVKEEKAEEDTVWFTKTGWYTIKSEPETIDSPKPKKQLMKKVSVLARKLFDADTRALVEASFLNDDLTLASNGKEALLNLLFLEYKKELAVEARRAIRAAKKEEEED